MDHIPYSHTPYMENKIDVLRGKWMQMGFKWWPLPLAPDYDEIKFTWTKRDLQISLPVLTNESLQFGQAFKRIFARKPRVEHKDIKITHHQLILLLKLELALWERPWKVKTMIQSDDKSLWECDQDWKQQGNLELHGLSTVGDWEKEVKEVGGWPKTPTAGTEKAKRWYSCLASNP